MKTSFKNWIWLLSLVGTIFTLINSCEKADEKDEVIDGMEDTNHISYGSVTDIDGNVYKTVTIGSQVWMAENLKTTKFNDGTSIPLITDRSIWVNPLESPGYCWYNNDISFKNPYGALYNMYAVNTGKLAPKGWHVPTHEEWDILNDYLGVVAGIRLKEAGTEHWDSPNNGNNAYGFTALPGGHRDVLGDFEWMGMYGLWWAQSNEGRHYYMGHDSPFLSGSRSVTYFTDGLSVRCVKD